VRDRDRRAVPVLTGKPDPALKRDIGFTGSAFLSFSGMVGAGIFALPATLHGQFGTFSPWLFPIFGLLFLLIALPFARLAGLHPVSGGPVAYTAPFGPLVSFQAGWLYYVARITALAANANVFAIYAASLWPPLGGTVGRPAVIVLLIGAITVINMVGVRRAVRMLDVLTMLKALPLIALAIWSLAWSAGSWPPPGPPPPLGALEAAALIILYAFVGFENSVIPADETANAAKTIPRALIATLATTIVIYFLVQLAYVSIMPAGSAPGAPLAALAEALVGPIGAILLTLTALASIAGNLAGSMTSTPRVTYALAARESLPRWFGTVSPRWATPANSILFMGLAGIALGVTGSFLWLAVVSTLARLFVYGLSIAALPKAEKPGAGTWTMVAAALAVCLWAATQSKAESWVMLGGLVAAGLLLYGFARLATLRRGRVPPTPSL
jgi:APA family basic amino acid/polyamine antiporter